MRKLFKAIRSGDLSLVDNLIAKNPELVNCIVKQPPKKDDGQSPLQVSLKTGHFDIAEYLIDNGADIDFIEKESCNAWKMPVLHDAIRATIMNTRYLKSDVGESFTLCNNIEQFERSFRIMKKMIELGANIDCHDSYSNSVLGRATLDARQVLPSYNHTEGKITDKKPLNIELVEDLNKVFSLLISSGADLFEIDPKYGRTLREQYKNEPVFDFIS